MEYLDFELAVEARADGAYNVSVECPAGEARAEMRLPYDHLVLDNKMKALQIALLRSGGQRRSVQTADDVAVEAMGRELFQALFSAEIAKQLEVSRIIARRESRGLRIKLRITPPELASLPWEYLYDDSRGDYFALEVGTPIVRYVPLPQSIRPLEVSPPIRVLAMVAAPSDLGQIDAERERQRLETALGELAARGLVELEWVQGERWTDLQEALWRGPWHVFHFIGHGGFSEGQRTGQLYMSGDDGNMRELSATDVGRLLGDHEPLRLVVLNSCDSAHGAQTDVFSSTAATLVRRGTPAVVAMQFEITDDAAIQFSQIFYSAIAQGMPVDAAVAEARKAVALQLTNTYEWGTPVLFMRSHDGQLFRIPTPKVAAPDLAAAVRESTGDAVVDRPASTPMETPPVPNERPEEPPVTKAQPQPPAQPARATPSAVPQRDAATERPLLPVKVDGYLAAAVGSMVGGVVAVVAVLQIYNAYGLDTDGATLLFALAASIFSSVGVFLGLLIANREEARLVATLEAVIALLTTPLVISQFSYGDVMAIVFGIGALGVAAVAARAGVVWWTRSRVR